MATDRDWQQQLVELQSQLAFQEDVVHQLNEALAAQQRELLSLRRELELLRERLAEQGRRLDGVEPGPPDERPPHY